MIENPDAEIPESPAVVAVAPNAFAARDVEEILRERGWLLRDGDGARGEDAPQLDAWLAQRAITIVYLCRRTRPSSIRARWCLDMSRTAYSHSRSLHNTFFDEINERFHQIMCARVQRFHVHCLNQ